MPKTPRPQPSVHVCNIKGVPDPYSYTWDLNFESDSLADRLAMVGLGRVLEPFERIGSYLTRRACAIAEAHLPPEQLAEFKLYSNTSSDFEQTFRDAACKAITSIVSNLPTIMDRTLEDMLQISLTSAGFCCSVAVDAFVLDRAQPELHNLLRLPDFDPSWLTLAGCERARQARQDTLEHELRTSQMEAHDALERLRTENLELLDELEREMGTGP